MLAASVHWLSVECTIVQRTHLAIPLSWYSTVIWWWSTDYGIYENECVMRSLNQRNASHESGVVAINLCHWLTPISNWNVSPIDQGGVNTWLEGTQPVTPYISGVVTAVMMPSQQYPVYSVTTSALLPLNKISSHILVVGNILWLVMHGCYNWSMKLDGFHDGCWCRIITETDLPHMISLLAEQLSVMMIMKEEECALHFCAMQYLN